MEVAITHAKVRFPDMDVARDQTFLEAYARAMRQVRPELVGQDSLLARRADWYRLTDDMTMNADEIASRWNVPATTVQEDPDARLEKARKSGPT